MNILVTGATGFLGNTITGKLLNAENQVVGIRRDHNRRFNLPHSPDVYVQGDIRDYEFIRRVIADYEIEEIYHCAAQAIVRSCANDPYTTFDINVMGTVALLEACRNSGDTVKSVVISTSDKSFGHTPPPYNEDTHLNPLYTYEVSKACQHMAALNFFNNYDVPVKIVASSNVYGPGDPNFSRIIPNTIRRLASGENAILNEGVANFVREFVYVDDVAEAFILVSRKGKPGELYCCGGTEHPAHRGTDQENLHKNGQGPGFQHRNPAETRKLQGNRGTMDRRDKTEKTGLAADAFAGRRARQDHRFL